MKTLARLTLALLLLALPARAYNDGTAPTISNLIVVGSALDESDGRLLTTICAQVTENAPPSSGVRMMSLVFPTAPYHMETLAGFTPEQCAPAKVSELDTCTTEIFRIGLCRKLIDCVSSDNCSSGGGSTVETVICNGTSWQVVTTAAHPTTACMERRMLIPPWLPFGTYPMSLVVSDRAYNTSSASAGSLVWQQ